MTGTHRRFGLALIAASLAAGAHAQTIALTPNSPSVPLGGTLQFSAQVTGLTSTAVTWSAGGRVGGNSTAGTISTSGLFTAPTTMPAQDPVQIVVTSAANKAVKAVTYVNLLTPGPAITSVSPNPLAVGTITVTVQGSGFLPGAEVYDSYGKYSNIQLTTITVTPMSVIATGYQGPGASAIFSVKNPGSVYSNSISVPVGTATPPPPPPPTTYILTVTSGTGSGTYAAGAVVPITANAAPSGEVFKNWTGATVANSTAASTTLTMPAANTTVTANYAAASPITYALTVTSGTGSGSYAPGAIVPITANTAPSGEVFKNWSGATVANSTAASTTLTMPAANTTVTANYTAASPITYALTVTSGPGSGSYAAGAVVPISANPAPSGDVFKNWTGATVVNSTAASTTLTMPAANTTVTANYTAASPTTYTLTVTSGAGSGSYAAGTVVPITANPGPSGQTFQGWTGATVANSTSASTTLTMPASNTTVTATYSVPSTIPYPVTTHPRLWITPADLPRLQSWATSSNQVYQQGLKQVLNTAVGYYNNNFFPGGVANPNYPDPGDTQGYTGLLTEEWGAILAFNSLIDPVPANRILYAQYARNMLMYAMNQAALGPASGAPFRDPMFAVYNRASESGEQWPLIVDWIYNAVDAGGNPILTATDKATIRQVFLLWASQCLTASTTGGDSPQMVGVTNSLQLLPGDLPYRMAANNYYTAHARLMTMMALAIDPSDDPPVNATPSTAVLGNSIRSYLGDATGAWLYQQWAMYGEPSAVASAYGIPGGAAGFGLASGGLPAEGMLYGVSYGNLLQGLLALQTAGFNNTAYSGPQIAMIGTPMWDRWVKGTITSLIPAPFTPTQPGESYLGQVYQFATYGDLLRLYVTPDYMMPFSLLAMLEQEQNQTTHLDNARWFNYNVVQGGPPAFYTRMTDPYTFMDTILYYLLYDPAASPASAADPRAGYPTMFTDAPQSRVIAHTNYSPTGAMFDYKATWESINHQDGNAGQFELFRKGEWLTKELSNYDSNGVGLTTYYHNTLGLQNACAGCADPTSVVNWWELGELANGSQWMLGQNAGDPTTHLSNGPGYVFADTDMTNLYNRPSVWTPGNAFNNITQATRSILWLNSDYVVVYDRAASLNTGLFKRWNLTLINNPVISGHTITDTLASGQQLFVQSLLPASSTFTARNALGDLSSVAELEPSQFVLTIQDPGNPTTTRFLHVLQGADAGAPMAPATYLQSTSGTAYDGAVFAGSAVYFPVNTGGFTGTTLAAPAGVHTMFVTGLTPNASYGYTVSPSGGGNSVAIGTGSGAVADAAGMLVLTF